MLGKIVSIGLLVYCIVQWIIWLTRLKRKSTSAHNPKQDDPCMHASYQKLRNVLDLLFIIERLMFLTLLSFPSSIYEKLLSATFREIVDKLRKSGITKILFHSWGLGSIASAIFLQLLVFKDILLQGYFLAMEPREPVLLFEIVITSFSLIYFVYIYCTFIQRNRCEGRG